MQEVFKEITGFDGYYVSNKGKIKHLRRLKSGRFTEKYLSINSHTQSVRLRKNDGSYKTVKVSHLVALAFLRDRAKGRRRIKHKDGNAKNNKPSNLCWEGLSTDDVIKIKHALKMGQSYYRVAKRFHINPTHVKRIAENKAWKNVNIQDDSSN